MPQWTMGACGSVCAGRGVIMSCRHARPGPGSHRKPLLPHRPAASGSHALSTSFEEERAVAVPLLSGSCTFHHGATLHYTRGNATSSQRRAYILNYRPEVRVPVWCGVVWCGVDCPSRFLFLSMCASERA